MKLMKLEELLEKGFEALGVEFGRRIFYEEYLAGAAIDDATGEVTIEEVKARPKEDGLLGVMKKRCSLSRAQSQVYDEDEDYLPPFLRRESGVYNHFWVEYELTSEEEGLSCYEDKADRIISERKVAVETVDIRADYGWRPSLVVFQIDYCEGMPRPINAGVQETDSIVVLEFLDKTGIDLTEKVEKILQLDGQPFNPDKIYKAVMEFIL